MIKSFGYQIFPGDVEAHICALTEKVANCVAVGVAHEVISEAVVALVEKRPGVELSHAGAGPACARAADLYAAAPLDHFGTRADATEPGGQAGLRGPAGDGSPGDRRVACPRGVGQRV